MEKLLSVGEVAQLFPSRKGHVSKNTVGTWATRGVKVGDQFVVLPSVHTPRGRCYTEAGVLEFMQKLQAARESQKNEKRQESNPQPGRAALIAAGVLKE